MNKCKCGSFAINEHTHGKIKKPEPIEPIEPPAKQPFSEIVMPVFMRDGGEALYVYDVDSNTWSLVRKEAQDETSVS